MKGKICAAIGGVVMLAFSISSCNQTPSTGTTDIPKPADEIVLSEAEPQHESDEEEFSDSVMTSGNYVVFFMQNGDWINETGADEAAADFSFFASEVLDSLDESGFSATFLIGDKITIGLENGTTFKINDPKCAMGVVLVSFGNEPELNCGVESAEGFWKHYKEYFK
ncbi:MAG TPA: hypothetical protein VNJ07_06820 [Chitinophagales bacterium]|nr:hypothetical protein [Chitinophagales bacterium]